VPPKPVAAPNTNVARRNNVPILIRRAPHSDGPAKGGPLWER
jgi:hypothetical protein